VTITTSKLRWSASEAPADIRSCEQLDRWLDKLSAATKPEHPSIVDVCVHGYEVGIGIGLPQSFVHVERDTGEGPYMITVGDTAADGVVAFYLHGDHHTEIACRHLIPTEQAREIVREFFDTGRRSASVEWEEV
jgi:hypothetical protein